MIGRTRTLDKRRRLQYCMASIDIHHLITLGTPYSPTGSSARDCAGFPSRTGTVLLATVEARNGAGAEDYMKQQGTMPRAVPGSDSERSDDGCAAAVINGRPAAAGARTTSVSWIRCAVPEAPELLSEVTRRGRIPRPVYSRKKIQVIKK